MAIPDQAYDLDDRKFQDLVYEARRRIPELCPQWTDHNLSDPGITLIELFASMVEQLLFRINKVPAKNYIKFLDLIGVTLTAAHAATTDITFIFTTSIPNPEGEEEPILIRKGTEISNDVEADSEEAIIFTTDEDVRVTAPNLEHLLISREDNDLFEDRLNDLKEESGPYNLFQETPGNGDAFYLGFTSDSQGENDISGVIVSLSFDCVERRGIGINPTDPPLIWEYWSGSVWTPFSRNERSEAWLESDGTMGFNQDGDIVLHIPSNIRKSPVFGRDDDYSPWQLLIHETDTGTVSLNGRVSYQDNPNRPEAYWIRCSIAPPRANQGRYRSSPQITGITSSAVGCTVKTSNALMVRNELLGRSSGKPGQTFKVSHDRMLPLREGDQIFGYVEVLESEENWVPWRQVDNFPESGPDDRHFVCQEATGEIFFGPVIGHPINEKDHDPAIWGDVVQGRPVRGDDSQPIRWVESQRGRIPKDGAQIRISGYRYGGGQIGNAPPNILRELRTNVPYVDTVTNRLRATGGVNPETVDNAIGRGPEHFRTMDRAVTAADFEYLASQASPDVGRAKCIQPKAPPELEDITNRVNANAPVPPGRIYLRIFPGLSMDRGFTPENVRCRPELMERVKEYLDERRLLGSVLLVEDANCKWVSVKATIMALPDANVEEVRQGVEEGLYRFIHPLKGGHDGNGWQFGKNLVVSELYHQIQQVPGVAYVRDLLVDEGHPDLGQIRELDPRGEIEIDDTELLCSREHFINVERL